MDIVTINSEFFALLYEDCYVEVPVFSLVATVAFFLDFNYAFVFSTFLNVDFVWNLFQYKTGS